MLDPRFSLSTHVPPRFCAISGPRYPTLSKAWVTSYVMAINMSAEHTIATLLNLNKTDSIPYTEELSRYIHDIVGDDDFLDNYLKDKGE